MATGFASSSRSQKWEADSQRTSGFRHEPSRVANIFQLLIRMAVVIAVSPLPLIDRREICRQVRRDGGGGKKRLWTDRARQFN